MTLTLRNRLLYLPLIVLAFLNGIILGALFLIFIPFFNAYLFYVDGENGYIKVSGFFKRPTNKEK